MKVPHLTLPSYVKIEVATSKLILLTKIHNQFHSYLEFSIDWQLQEID